MRDENANVSAQLIQYNTSTPKIELAFGNVDSFLRPFLLVVVTGGRGSRLISEKAKEQGRHFFKAAV